MRFHHLSQYVFDRVEWKSDIQAWKFDNGQKTLASVVRLLLTLSVFSSD
jgi:hypothetical protein